ADDRLEARRPVALQPRFTLRSEAQPMTGRKRLHLAEDGARAEHMAEAEEVVDSALVDIEREAGDIAQRIDLRPEREAAVLLGHEQRLDPERIADQQQRPRLAVPDRRRVHAVRLEPRLVAPGDEGGEQGLDVASGRESIGWADLAAELGMIDDLAIGDDRITTVGAIDR